MIAEAILKTDSGDVEIGFEGGAIRIKATDRPNLPIRSTPDVMGGDVCIRETRIPVWLIVRYKQSGYSDDRSWQITQG